MKNGLGGFAFLVFLIFVLSIGSPLWAQSGGTLKGTVVDGSEKFPLPTVRISLAGTKIFGVSDMDGNFSIANIPAGTYKVSFELAGYLLESKSDIIISGGQTATLDIKMRMGFAHEVSVTATRSKLVLQRLPQNIEVITATELEEQPLIDVVHALNNVTGVDVETGSGLTGVGTFMSINGYDDDYIRKMVDGVDMGQVVSNWSMLNAYPTAMLEQVEVIKGGASSVWGANMGGIINLVTKRPRHLERPIITLKSTVSAFGEMDFANASSFPNPGTNYLQRYSASILGNAGGFSYMLGGSLDNFDGFTDYAKEKNFSLFTKVGYDFSDRTYLDFFYSYNKLDGQSRMTMTSDAPPGSLYLWNNFADARASTQVGYVKFSSYVRSDLNVEAQLKFTKWHYDGEWTYLADAPPWEPAAGTVVPQKFTDQKWGFSLKSSFRPTTDVSVIGGLDYYRVKADFSFIENQPIIFVDQWAPFLNGEFRLGPVGLHVGVRHDSDSSFGGQTSPSIGATLNFMKATLIRVNVARTFKVPPLWYTLGESYYDVILPNPDLKPERAWAYSIGFETQELKYVWLKLSLFSHKMQNGIVTAPYAPNPSQLSWANTDDFLRQGYEAEIGFMTDFGLSGYFGTNFNKHENLSEDVIATWVPTRSYKPRIKYKNSKLDFLISLQGRWLWWNEEASPWAFDFFLPEDKKWIIDIRVSKGINFNDSTRMEVFLDIFNLTDQLYWDRLDVPNPRRWIALGFEMQFK